MDVKLQTTSCLLLLFIGQKIFSQSTKQDSLKTKDIDKVVILGYSKKSSQTKSTVSATMISSEVLQNRPNISFLNSLQGTASGLSVNSASGSPGSGKMNIRIRGLGSIYGSTDPLYVIDGLAASGNQFRNLNQNDIETISVLKDAASTSIYGNRGANGVIVITTKGAKYNTALKVSYDALTSFSTLPKTHYNLANSQELLTIQKGYGNGKGVGMSQAEIDAYDINTDWGREFFRTGMSQQHNLGLRFGGENVAVYSSLGYLESDGNIKSTDFKRFTFRNNITGKSKNKKLTYNSQLAIGYSKRHQLDQEEDADINGNMIQNVLFGSVLGAPILNPSPYTNGKEMYQKMGSNFAGKRVWILQDNMRGGVQNLFSETSILANISATYKLNRFLSVGNSSGIDFKQYDREYARSPLGYLSSYVAAGQGAKYSGYEELSHTKDFTFTSVTNLTFNHSFNEHHITASAYLEYIKGHFKSTTQLQTGLDPLSWVLGAGTGYIPFDPATPNLYLPKVKASKVNAGMLSAFATLDYDFAGKYGFSGTLRRDGSYRFKPENRWESFWSISGRWNLEKEEFLKDTSVQLLKIRASYGTQGNQSLFLEANNMNTLFVQPNIIRDLAEPNVGYQNMPGYGVGKIANRNLRWEETNQLNAGLDFAFFRGKLEGTFDYYIKNTQKLFNDIDISAATSLYTIKGNNGHLRNTGVEAFLRFHIADKDRFRLSIFANGAYNNNKIISMETQKLDVNNVNAIGGTAYQWQLYRYVGVNKETGEQQFLDKNGNITESPVSDDRILTGKSYLPKFNGGFGFDISYKGFFASTLFTYQMGGWQYDDVLRILMTPSSSADYNVSADLLRAWTPENPNTNIPALKAKNTGTERSSDKYLRKTDFLRLKNVSVGYRFTKDQLANIPIHTLRIFLQAENIYTWTNIPKHMINTFLQTENLQNGTGWRGYDPEPLGPTSSGVYPNPKVFSVGINVEF